MKKTFLICGVKAGIFSGLTLAVVETFRYTFESPQWFGSTVSILIFIAQLILVPLIVIFMTRQDRHSIGSKSISTIIGIFITSVLLATLTMAVHQMDAGYKTRIANYKIQIIEQKNTSRAKQLKAKIETPRRVFESIRDREIARYQVRQIVLRPLTSFPLNTILSLIFLVTGSLILEKSTASSG